MSTVTPPTPPRGFVQPGNCHRIALAVHDVKGAMAQWQRVFGAGVMFEHVHDELDGSDMGMVWMGDMPFLALGSADPDGLVGRWLSRNGPGVQSLAWEVPDMWASQNYLQQLGIGITGVHVEGRHFFLHPRDTFGLMLELTDDRLPGDPRQGLTPIGGGDGLVPVQRVVHVHAVVPELDPVVAQFDRVFGVTAHAVDHADDHAHDNADAAAVVDFVIGDLTLRVIERRDTGRGSLQSVALAVDLDAARTGLEQASIAVADETASLLLDPTDTFGIRLELLDA